MQVRITDAPFSPEATLAAFTADRRDIGALASFTGYCREETRGEAVTQLVLEHYPGFTDSEIVRIGEAMAHKYDLTDLLVIHRVGALSPGEPIVLVAALSAHRTAAFAAVEALMDYLKTDAPFWKREVGPDGARWIEPTAEDRARRARHNDKDPS